MQKARVAKIDYCLDPKKQEAKVVLRVIMIQLLLVSLTHRERVVTIP